MKTAEKTFRITHDQATAAARKYHDAAFNAKPLCLGIPPRPDDPDLLLFGYIEQQEADESELRAQLEALTVLLRAKCSDREWAEMCKKFDGECGPGCADGKV